MAQQGKDITLYGGGHNKRTFTHMSDLCYQLIMASQKPESNGEIYNIGGEILSLREAAECIAKIYQVNIVDIDWPDRDLRIESGHTYFDAGKIQHLLGNMEYKKLSTIDF